jgi:hypothetical protein
MFKQNIIIIFLVFIILILLFNKENMDPLLQRIKNSKDYNFKFLNPTSSYILYNNLYTNDEPIEITKLQKCDKSIISDYGINSNTLNNDNYSVYQDIINPLFNIIKIDNIEYNLSKVSFKKSRLTYENKKIGLNIELMHQNYNSINKIIVVIPLDFIPNKVESISSSDIKETFINTNLKKMTLYPDQNNDELYYNNLDATGPISTEINDLNFQKKINSEKNKFNIKFTKNNKTKNIILDKFIINEVLIPNYVCCTDTVGNVIKFNFCDLQNIINISDKFFQLEDQSNNTYLILEPIKFPENIGIYIRNNIIDDNNVKFIKQ